MSEDLKIDYGEGVWPPEGFTGLWEVYWPNRQLKYRAHFIDGKEHGRVTSWWDNGRLAQTGICDHGSCVGIWPDYWEDGGKSKETEYASPGTFVVRWYDLDGTIKRVQRWIDGDEVQD